MPFLADLHIHSPYSRATSKLSTLSGLHAWAQVKGIQVIGTGDFTHPAWFNHLKDELIPARDGLYQLARPEEVPPALPGISPEEVDVRFCLTAEISSIYKRHGQVRKVHNIIFAPDLPAVQRFNRRLAGIGNIEADGRPILGLDSRDLLEIVLEEIPGGFLVPAHIWTPWFSLFGSKSGFDTIEECYGDLSHHIFALETGLSSDPAMNRLVSSLDPYTFISNSDCHSPSKLGREANIFTCDLSFAAMRGALEDPRQGLAGTLEFYPEEGKYHLDGHRKCGVCLDPLTSREQGKICPQCGKPLTIGVSHRVMELADRDTPLFKPHDPTFESLVPLCEILSELCGVGPATKTVLNQYIKLINRFGSEFQLLRATPVEDLGKLSPLLAEAIRRLRSGEVIRQGGFDGQFGVIHLFGDGEMDNLRGQQDLFAAPRRKKQRKIPVAAKASIFSPDAPAPDPSAEGKKKVSLNKGQKEAVTARGNQLVVAAGPGTGKTFVLVQRIRAKLTAGQPGEKISAITFTNRAAREIRERLNTLEDEGAKAIFTGTFHAFCLHWLRRAQPSLKVIGDKTRQLILKQLFPALDSKQRQEIRAEIISHCHFLATRKSPPPPSAVVKSYLGHLEQAVAIDLDLVIPTFLVCLRDHDFLAQVQDAVRVLLVDEFQDANLSQFELVRSLGCKAQVFIIGDPDQAIYGFRGSDMTLFSRFAIETGARTINLNKNYRCGREIIAAAASLIRHNKERSGLRLEAATRSKGAISHHSLEEPGQEALFIATEIERLMGGTSNLGAGGEGGYGFNDIGILMRMNRQAPEITHALAKRGLPCQQVGATPFFMSSPCRLLSLFILAAAKRGEISDLLELCQGLPGVGQGTVALLEQNLPLDTQLFWSGLEKLELPARVGRQLSSLVDLLTELAQTTELAPATLEAACGLLGLATDNEKIIRLVNLCQALGSLAGVADHLEQGREAIIYDQRAEAISLMTLHSAKGLEFPVVFICGLEEGVIPYLRPGGDLEEERRLFYVGLSRAGQRLYLTSCRHRFGKECQKSRFLGELPAMVNQENPPKVPPQTKVRQKAKQLKLF
ncbi:MAG: UvrD-helicase domain-containing protein [Thermodesulfobacteriota bacterium]